MADLAGGTDVFVRRAGEARRRETDHAGKTSEGRRIKADALDAIARDIQSITGKNCLQRSAMGLRK